VQLAVHERRQLIQRLVVASAPGQQQPGEIRLIVSNPVILRRSHPMSI
jgi:hypothetical protein